MRRLLSSIEANLANGARGIAPGEGLKALYRVSLYRNAVYLILDYAATAVLGFLFWILAARVYPAEEVGLASAAVAVAGLLAALSVLGLDYTLIRFLPASGERSAALINSCLTIGALVAMAVSLVFLAGLPVWSPDLLFLRQSPLLAGTFVVLVVSGLLHPQLRNVFVAQKRAEFGLWQGLVQGTVRLLLVALLATSALGFGIMASYGIGWVLAVMVGLLLLLPRLRRGYRPAVTIRKEVMRETVRYSLANYVAGLVNKVPVAVLPLLVVSRVGAEQNAYFYIAFAVIGGGLNAIPASVSLSLFAEGSHREESLGYYVRRSLRFTLSILVPLILLIFLVGDRVLLAFGQDYAAEATGLLRVLAIASLPFAVNTIYFFKKRVEREMRSVIGLTVLMVVITLGLSYYLLPIMGLVGAGVGWLAGNGVVSLAVAGDLLRKGAR